MNAPITFYSASAGSGKTFTLARDYLTLLFQSPMETGYRNILAVTFTNKAVAEMKARIVEYLRDFTLDEIPPSITAIANHIKAETGLKDGAFRARAIKIYHRLLHDYAAFDIVTIDAFNHRILRTFSKDLNLPDGFEVELDSKNLVSKAIHNLIARAGNDTILTQQLINFSMAKIEDGKSWDIEYDLQDIAKLILNENHYNHLKRLKEKTLDDFLYLQKDLKAKIKSSENRLIEIAIPLVELVQTLGIATEDFKGGHRSSPFNTVIKASNGDLSVVPGAASIRDLLSGDLYPKGRSQEVKDSVDSIKDQLRSFAVNYIELWGGIMFHKNILKGITPLSLLNEILLEIDRIKTTDRIVPIYEFNGLLAEQIKDQPAPFIYERLGERYSHFFIDEFQDTSVMQWENMSPLVSNALQQELPQAHGGSLMLVGDAKQSIYRWRGGDVNQFLNLLQRPQLFFLDKESRNLEFNWRSYDEIITFNNAFFDYYGDYLENPTYKNLYKEFLSQKTRSKPGGYIRVDFLEKEMEEDDGNDDNISTVFPAHVHHQIEDALGHGFVHGDICILVRANKQGNEIATYLVAQGISVVSADSLLVQHSEEVGLLVNFMEMVLQPFQQETRYNFLKSFATFKNLENKHEFFYGNIHLEMEELILKLFGSDGFFISSAFAKAPLFKATEDAASHMGLLITPDTRLQTFLNLVFEYTTGYDVSLSGFLEHWDTKKENLSVPAMPDEAAVQIMTIHKSKGLEFPVVIVPHCDLSIQDIKRDNGWIPLDPMEYNGFDEAFISINNTMEFYPDPGSELLSSHIEQSQMDQINVLYVAFTRAREQLYISCLKRPESSGVKKGETPLNYSQVLDRFLSSISVEGEDHDNFISYELGIPSRKSVSHNDATAELLQEYTHNFNGKAAVISTSKGVLWAENAEAARQRGTVLHNYLSLIHTADDLEQVFKKIDRDRSLSSEETTGLKNNIGDIVNNPVTARFFTRDQEVINEQKILMPQGENIIPDRLLIKDGELTIIDYKSGVKSQKHLEQIESYARILTSMGYRVKESLLIYTDQMEVVTLNQS
jgi:ATP-dependent exoDNAse (exonuclease V) beta subunit